MRWAIHVFVTTALFAVLYRYWLTTPVLQYVSVTCWRLFAIIVSALCGVVLSLLRVSTPALSCEVMAGLLLGGTWAAWTSPPDVTISVCDAFRSHLESLWQEVFRLAFVATLAAFCCDYFRKRREHVRLR